MTNAQIPVPYCLTAEPPNLDHSLSPVGAAPAADAAEPRCPPSPPTPSALLALPPSPPPTSPPSPIRTLPRVTTGTSETYVHAAAAAVTNACLTDPLNLLFLREMAASPSTSTSTSTSTPDPAPSYYQPLYSCTASRLRAKLRGGSFVAEAGGFAAVACWEPLGAGAEPQSGAGYGGAAFAAFAAQVRDFKRGCVDPAARRLVGGGSGSGSGSGRSWHVCLTARDPGREYVAGAVRAVLVPFMRRVTGEEEGEGEEGEKGEKWGKGPVWLEASNDTARDVYAHFGFRVLRVMETMGVRTYGMIYTGSLEKGGNGDGVGDE